VKITYTQENPREAYALTFVGEIILEKQPKNSTKPAKDTFKAERAQRGEQNPPPAADQLGATDQQVQPLTPPMAKSDQQPHDPQRGKQPDKEIDPADELTPG
jgi:hypothetical protein